MWVGNTLIINDHKFILTGTDEYTLKYMNKNYDEVINCFSMVFKKYIIRNIYFRKFPKANVKLILDKIINKLLSCENGYKDFVAKNLDASMNDGKKLMPKFKFE